MLKVPVYDQLNDRLPDGNLDKYATQDCGSESVAEVGAAFGFGGDVGFSAGQVRQIIRHGDFNGSGLTTADDLVYGLASCFRLPSHVRNANFTQLKQELQRAVAAKMPCIVLGGWVDPAVLHWIVVIDATPGGITFNDSWGGKVRSLAWADVAKLYAGTYCHLDKALA